MAAPLLCLLLSLSSGRAQTIRMHEHLKRRRCPCWNCWLRRCARPRHLKNPTARLTTPRNRDGSRSRKLLQSSGVRLPRSTAPCSCRWGRLPLLWTPLSAKACLICPTCFWESPCPPNLCGIRKPRAKQFPNEPAVSHSPLSLSVRPVLADEQVVEQCCRTCASRRCCSTRSKYLLAAIPTRRPDSWSSSRSGRASTPTDKEKPTNIPLRGTRRRHRSNTDPTPRSQSKAATWKHNYQRLQSFRNTSCR